MAVWLLNLYGIIGWNGMASSIIVQVQRRCNETGVFEDTGCWGGFWVSSRASEFWSGFMIARFSNLPGYA